MISHLSSKVPAVDIENTKEQTIPQARERSDLQISVVIVSYNSRELLRACITSIESEPYNQVIVIDNASSDGSEEMVSQDFPWARAMKRDKNEGYGAAANAAIASCSSEYVLVLNCDTFLQPGTLQALGEYLDQHPRAAIVGPALVNPNGTRQASCFSFPTPWETLLKETSLPRLIGRLSKNGSDRLSTSPRQARVVPWVLGAALAIRRSAFESVGGFDRSFFMYFEEVDLCYRLKKSGWETHFTPTATVTHIGGASTKQHRTAMAVQLYKSLCHFYRQHYSHIQSFQLKLVLTYLMLRNILKDAFRFAQRSHSREADWSANDLRVWRSVLSEVWSANGWLKS